MVVDSHQCCYREQLAYSFYSKFCEPKLFRLAAKGDFDMIPARCRSHPKEATFVHKYAPNDTALHCLFRYDDSAYYCDDELNTTLQASKLAAVAALLDANPQAATTPNAFYRVPLHLACMDLSCIPAATLLIERATEAVIMRDVEKRTPLHYLIARRHEHTRIIPTEVVALLLQHGPEAVSIPDAVGETPVDVLQRCREEIDNTDEIYDMLVKVVSVKEDRSP